LARVLASPSRCAFPHAKLTEMQKGVFPKIYFWKNLTFRGPCIVIYSYNNSQRDALLSQIYLIKYSKCFGHVHCPLSTVHCPLSTVHCPKHVDYFVK
jgi:hypothetical protein